MDKNNPQTRILLKLSGESFNSGSPDKILNPLAIDQLVVQLKELYQHHYQIAIVVGGGNIFRGKDGLSSHLDSQAGDFIGMMATVINGLTLHQFLKQVQLPSKVYSALNIEGLTNPINYEQINEDIKHSILIFTAGVGEPNFSTDSGAALRAIELHCDLLLMGKNGVDGVYDQDPKLNPDAKFYQNLSFFEAISKNLKVMDLTAFALCQQAKLEIRVFNINLPHAIVDVLNDQIKYTKIKD